VLLVSCNYRRLSRSERKFARRYHLLELVQRIQKIKEQIYVKSATVDNHDYLTAVSSQSVNVRYDTAPLMVFICGLVSEELASLYSLQRHYDWQCLYF
jgi:hypothetical protein